MVTGDIESILFGDLSTFGITVYKNGTMPEGKVTEERIVIIPESLKDDVYWKKCNVEVRICVPDIQSGDILVADKERLGVLERQAGTMESVSSYNDSTYLYSVSEISQEKDAELECHYVSVKLLFEILNVK